MFVRRLVCLAAGCFMVASCAGSDSGGGEAPASTQSEQPEAAPGSSNSETTSVLSSPTTNSSLPASSAETTLDAAPFAVLTGQSPTGDPELDRVDSSLGVLGDAPQFAWSIGGQEGFVDDAVAVDGVVVVSVVDDDGATTILGLEGSTGDAQWTKSIDARQDVSLHAVRGALVVVSIENRVAGSMTRLDPATGEELWESAVSAEPILKVRNRYGSLIQFDPDTEQVNIFDLESGQVALRHDPGLAANLGWVVRTDQIAQVMDFETFEPVGGAITLSALHDSTSTLGVIVGDQVVQSIDNAIVIFDSMGREVGRTDTILNSPGVAPVAFSESLVLFTQNGATTVIDVSAEAGVEAVWESDLQPNVIGAHGSSVFAHVSELPPSGGQRTGLIDLSTGTEVCALQTDGAAEVFRDGFFADATAYGLDCEPRWSIEGLTDEWLVAHDGGVLVVDPNADPKWFYFQSTPL